MEEKLDTLHMGRGQRGTHGSATHKGLYQVYSHRYSTLILLEEQKKHGFSHCKEEEKKRQSRGKDTKGNDIGKESFLETWSQDFGAACSVYMTSCTVSHYLPLLDAERLRDLRKETENKMKTQPSPRLETIRMG